MNASVTELPGDILQDDVLPAVTRAAAEVMAIDDVMMGGQASNLRGGQAPAATPDVLLSYVLGGRDALAAAVRVRGRLLIPSDQAYARLTESLRPLGRTPVLRKDKETGAAVLLAVPGALKAARQRVGLAATLFGLTVLSCLYTGALYAENATSWLPRNWLDGLPFAASLLAILVSHEFGHYLVARHYGVPTSLPYFIPMPLSPFGTMGAVINMTAPPRNRRQLLAVGAAGPLAGLIVALPILWIGLSQSAVGPLPAHNYSLEGNSLLYALVKFLQFGRFLPSGGYDVMISPVAFAGWAGLLVTALNLIPAGQLDGGHIFDALAGERPARILFWGVLIALGLLSILWSGWLLWVALVFVFGRLRVPPLDDMTGLTGGQRALAVLMVIIFVLVFTPIPWTDVR